MTAASAILHISDSLFTLSLKLLFHVFVFSFAVVVPLCRSLALRPRTVSKISREDEVRVLCESEVSGGSSSLRNTACARDDECFGNNADKEHCKVSLNNLSHTHEKFLRTVYTVSDIVERNLVSWPHVMSAQYSW